MVEVKNEAAEEKVQENMQGAAADGPPEENHTDMEAEKNGAAEEDSAGEDSAGKEPAGEDSAAADKEQKETPEKKKGQKKKQKKDKRDEKIEELNDRLVRNLAEFENFRNRSEKEKSAMFEIGAKSVIEKILPVVDNMERGFDGLSDEEKETPFAKGIEAVYKQLMTAFEEMGVVPIEAVGQEFDPDFHNAVMHDEDDSEETNKVIEEFQKGYMYKDTVVRHSMVKVLN